jgi:hypothetical protein
MITAISLGMNANTKTKREDEMRPTRGMWKQDRLEGKTRYFRIVWRSGKQTIWMHDLPLTRKWLEMVLTQNARMAVVAKVLWK